jgi:hypothetical protein
MYFLFVLRANVVAQAQSQRFNTCLTYPFCYYKEVNNTQEVKKPSKTIEMMNHTEHVDYPITGKDFMAACNNMSHVSKEERDWVKLNVSETKTYNSEADLKRALKL